MPRKTASENRFPLLRLRTIDDTPATPPAGELHLVGGVDKILRYIDEDGTLYELGLAGAGVPDGADPGDLLAWDGAAWAVLAVGDDGKILAADSGEPLGLAWVDDATGGGGGGLTQAYVGYNTVGASWETPGVNNKTYWKSITVAAACLITSVGAYVQHASGTASGWSCALYSDSSGPSALLGHGPSSTGPLYGLAATTPRWVEVPLGIWVPAGTYWVALRDADLGGSVFLQIAYDGSGSDRTATGFANRWDDIAGYTVTTTSNRYSVRANTIR